jgi:Lar family restriction alleviation protein
MTDKLKRCPFCGGKADLTIKPIPTEKDNPIIHDFKYEYAVRCNKCKARVGYYKSIKTAENAWNRRANNDR